jgi:hypothetical protein
MPAMPSPTEPMNIAVPWKTPATGASGLKQGAAHGGGHAGRQAGSHATGFLWTFFGGHLASAITGTASIAAIVAMAISLFITQTS